MAITNNILGALGSIGLAGFRQSNDAERSYATALERHEQERAVLTRIAHDFGTHFRRMFESAGGRLPDLQRVWIDDDLSDASIRIHVQCEGVDVAELRIAFVDVQGSRDLVRDVERVIREQYSQAYENAYVERGVRQQRARLEELICTSNNPEVINAAYESLYQAERHLREHHRYRQYQRAPSNLDLARNALALAYAQQNALRAELRYSHVQDALRYMQSGFGDVGTPEAQERGLQLLKENLTPKQREQYETHKHFDVKGNVSGKTYRIKHGRQMNIKELDKNGKRVRGLCFLPNSSHGALVAGDCMLAQKIALETDETATLKIANKF